MSRNAAFCHDERLPFVKKALPFVSFVTPKKAKRTAFCAFCHAKRRKALPFVMGAFLERKASGSENVSKGERHCLLSCSAFCHAKRHKRHCVLPFVMQTGTPEKAKGTAFCAFCHLKKRERHCLLCLLPFVMLGRSGIAGLTS